MKSLCNKLPYSDKEKLIGRINYIKKYRDSYQHLDERFDRIIEGGDKPVFGVLTWVYFNLDISNEEHRYSFISGIHKRGNFEFFPYNSNKLNSGINHITLQTFLTDESEILVFDKLLLDLIHITKTLENAISDFAIENNLQLCDWSSRQDITIKFVPETPNIRK